MSRVAKSVIKGRPGWLLVEYIWSLTIILWMCGIGLFTYSTFQNEYVRFDTVSRELHSTMKRVQIASLYGNINGLAQRNTMYIYERGFATDTRQLGGTQGMRELPTSMYIKVRGHYRGGFDFDEHTGKGDPYTCTIYDADIRRYRTYIFSRQTGRIRWEEGSY